MLSQGFSDRGLAGTIGADDGFDDSTAPYLGIGFGRIAGKRGLGVVMDLGVAFHGEPDVQLVSMDLNEGGTTCRACRSGTSVSAAAWPSKRRRTGGRSAGGSPGSSDMRSMAISVVYACDAARL